MAIAPLLLTPDWPSIGAPSAGEGGERRPLNALPLSLEMKLQAVMENLHRQQRAKLLMEQQLQQQAASQQTQVRMAGGNELIGSPAPETEQTQIAALAAMRAAAAGLQRVSDSPMSERSSGGDEEGDNEDNDEGEEQYKDMMGSDEEEQM